MSLSKFFKLPIVQFSIHIMIVFGFALNIHQLYKIWGEDARIQQAEEDLLIIKNRNNDYKNSGSYLYSDYYRDKYAKQQSNLKKDGEMIIDTSSFEGADSENNFTYIPKETEERKTKVEKWMDCFFSSTRDKCIKK